MRHFNFKDLTYKIERFEVKLAASLKTYNNIIVCLNILWVSNIFLNEVVILRSLQLTKPLKRMKENKVGGLQSLSLEQPTGHRIVVNHPDRALQKNRKSKKKTTKDALKMAQNKPSTLQC